MFLSLTLTPFARYPKNANPAKCRSLPSGRRSEHKTELVKATHCVCVDLLEAVQSTEEGAEAPTTHDLIKEMHSHALHLADDDPVRFFSTPTSKSFIACCIGC